MIPSIIVLVENLKNTEMNQRFQDVTEFFINIPCFIRAQSPNSMGRSLQTVTPGNQRLARENVQARIFLVHWRQVLGLEQDGRVVVDSLPNGSQRRVCIR